LIHLRRNLHGNTKGLTGPYVRVSHANNEAKIIVFHRWAQGGPKDDVILAASFANRAIEDGYRIGLPHGGDWIIRFNSDWKGYSPDFHDVSNPDGRIVAEKKPYDGCAYSGIVSLPPYGFLVLSQEEASEETEADDPKTED
jgi:1,4-alpha-glucan branching enzyme